MTNGFDPGTVLGRYRIDGAIGTGGMGTVYHATRLDGGGVFAIKALHPHIAKKAEHQKRFLREARAAMATNHPNVVRIEEVFEYDDAPIIAMELLEGESLEKLILREKRVPLDRFSRIMICVTSAVGSAHAVGIVHRDLKPDNIFIGEGRRVKVLDFGIAKLTATHGAAAETEALTRTGMLMGTPFYMSPEQAFGEKKVDHRSDIWSLGIISYYALSGILPTYGNSFADVFRLVISGSFPPLETLVPGIPAEVAALVAKMIRLDPAERPWDLRDVYATLQRYTDVAAPSFGVAVAPLFDELSNEYDAAERQSIETAATSAPGDLYPLAFAPAQLRLTPGGSRPLGMTPSGTIAMQSTTPVSPTLNDSKNAMAPRDPSSFPWIAVIAGVVLAISLLAMATLLLH